MPGVARILVGIIAFVTLALGLSGCSARPSSDVLRPVEQVPLYTSKVRLLVATTRERGTDADPDAYSYERARALNYAALTVSIPKNHVAGRIEWPHTGKPDASEHFMTTDRHAYTQGEFASEIAAHTRRPGDGNGKVLVFVHGYNTRYEEAVYRFAQVVHDSKFEGTAVLFAWPSRGSAPLYIADRDASNYSRDYFENALLEIARIPEVHEIDILAHSMGSWLTMEALRQAKMKGHGNFHGKLGEVILASPDLDVTVFRTQLDVVGALPRPMTVLVSGDDTVLAIATLLAGGVDRAGNLTADDARVIAGAKRYNINVVDLTGVDDGSASHHSTIFKSNEGLNAVGHALRSEHNAKSMEGGIVSAVTGVGTSILKVPAAILGAQ